MQFAVVRGVGAGRDVPHLTLDHHAGLAGEGHSIVGPCQRASEHALHEAIAVTQGDEAEILLLPLSVHATIDDDASATVRGAVVELLRPLSSAEFDNFRPDLAQVDPLCLGQAGVLGDDNLLGLLERLLALTLLLLLPQSKLLLFAGLLLLLLDPVGGLLQRSLGGGLVGGDLLIALLAVDQVGGRVGVLLVGELHALVGLGLAAVLLGLVEAGLLVDVDHRFVRHGVVSAIGLCVN